MRSKIAEEKRRDRCDLMQITTQSVSQSLSRAVGSLQAKKRSSSCWTAAGCRPSSSLHDGKKRGPITDQGHRAGLTL